MRPQQKPFFLAALLLFATTVAIAGEFLPSSPIRDQMRKESLCENLQNCRQPDLRLNSEVARLTNAVLFSASRHKFPSEQWQCIVRASNAYVTHWIHAMEAGSTPEVADQSASRQLDDINFACNVTVLPDQNGVTMPVVGGPCAMLTSQPYANLDAGALRVCLQQTLEFWTSYLYIPTNQ
jgi:hypothetical protein